METQFNSVVSFVYFLETIDGRLVSCFYFSLQRGGPVGVGRPGAVEKSPAGAGHVRPVRPAVGHPAATAACRHPRQQVQRHGGQRLHR